MIFSKLKNIVSDVLFPPICLICKNYLEDIWKEKFICEKCLATVPINTGFYCSECKKRMPNYKKICHPSPAFIYGAATTYNYEPVKNLIWQLKFRGQRCAAKALAEVLSIYCFREAIDWKKFHGIIPIPLYHSRERARGYNQSEIISKILINNLKQIYGGSTSIDLLNGVLIRVKNTEIQTDKNMQERRFNLENAFSVVDLEKIRNKNFILIDDVFTSGATLQSSAQSLKNAGAKRIIALTIAKV